MRSREVFAALPWLMPLLLLMPMLTSCGGRKDPPAEAAVPVVVALAERRDVPVEVRGIATVEASSTVAVKPQVGGVITTVHFAEGADVRKGDLLFTIDPRPSEASLRQAESGLARDRAQLSNAESEARRAEELYSQGILAKEPYDQLHAASDALAGTVRADEAAVENARLQLEYCSIRSPIDGRAGSLLVHGGNLVKAIDGGPLVVINRVDPVYVDIAAPEGRLAEIKRALASRRLVMEASIPGEEARAVRGELSFVDNAVDRQTGTIRLRGTFANPQKRLWPGQFVSARITLGVRTGAVVVPSQALQTGQSGAFVFVIKPDLTAESRPVEAGGEEGDMTVVEKGLAAGERVVTDGQLRLVPGAKVELKAAGAAS